MATKEIASKARAILAKAYRDNGDLGAANYVEAGLDLTPDTQVHLLAIIDALANRPQPVEVPDPAQSHPEVYALANDGVSVPDDLAGLREALERRDAAYAVCPFKGPNTPDHMLDCTVCGANSSEPCRKRVIADAEFVDEARTALNQGDR